LLSPWRISLSAEKGGIIPLFDKAIIYFPLIGKEGSPFGICNTFHRANGRFSE